MRALKAEGLTRAELADLAGTSVEMIKLIIRQGQRSSG